MRLRMASLIPSPLSEPAARLAALEARQAARPYPVRLADVVHNELVPEQRVVLPFGRAPALGQAQHLAVEGLGLLEVVDGNGKVEGRNRATGPRAGAGCGRRGQRHRARRSGAHCNKCPRQAARRRPHASAACCEAATRPERPAGHHCGMCGPQPVARRASGCSTERLCACGPKSAVALTCATTRAWPPALRPS